MLEEFGGEMVNCDRVLRCSWGPKVMGSRPPMDENTPKIQAANRARIIDICAAIQSKINQST